MPSQEFFETLIDQAPDAVIFADREGIIRVWNGGAKAIFGYEAEEAIGESLDLIIPEDLREAHWRGFERAMQTGETKYGRRVMTTRSIHKEGERIYVNLSFAVIRSKTGDVLGAMAQARDYTARYLEEKSRRIKKEPESPESKECASKT